MAKWIISYFPAHRVYVESYSGAASVLLCKDRSYAEVYNDLDSEIVNLFRVLRDPMQARELLRLLRLTPYSRSEFEASYLIDGDPVEQGRRTVVRSFMGFSSTLTSKGTTGFRSNSNRSGTAPSHDWRNYPEALELAIERLRGVVIENKNALDVMGQHDSPKTLHYVDPPYPLSTRSNGKGNYRHDMSEAQHIELAETLHSLEGMIVLSGYPCDLYDIELYSDWRRVEREALADGGQKRIEVLWINPNADAALDRGSIQGGLFK